jgi:hypothetical protein
VRDPLSKWLRPGPPVAAESVAAALARALLPAVAVDKPPCWLRGDQGLSFGRALAAVRRYGGAVLADGVGTGKTFIALAVAAALEPGRAIHVLAPAALLPQWRDAARRVGLEIVPHSHETLSRGRMPPPRPGPAVIDESHRFRTAATLRYQTLAPWCVGRRALLLSATPVVNRLEDLGRQLLLLVRDDALGWAGVASLRAMEDGAPAAALATLVITGEDRSGSLPGSQERELLPREPAGSPFVSLQRSLLELSLSPDCSIRALLLGVLLAALASSPLALAEALGRYRSLLQHARDARAAGRSLSRQAIRRMVGGDGDQLVMWPLVAEEVESPQLALEDLAAVEALEAVARRWGKGPDAKLSVLRSVLGEDRCSLVFTAATATVQYIRRQLGPGVAWCTGQASGLDAMPVPRDEVLDWFRRATPAGSYGTTRPRLLVATDVAAEGLDLALVQRVIHYDLPWTAVRLEQRSGRALRLGSRHASIEVIRLLPPPGLEARLRQQAILRDKAGLPLRLGLGGALDAPWRIRARVAAQWQGVSTAQGVGASCGPRNAVVTGFRICTSDGTHEVVRASTEKGWTDDAAVIADLLDSAHGVTLMRRPASGWAGPVSRGLTAAVRRSLRSINGARLPAGALPARRTLRRLLALARDAARTRDLERLMLLQRGLAVLRRGQTAGEARLAESWLTLSARELLGSLARLPAEPAAPEIERVELIGVLVVERRS